MGWNEKMLAAVQAVENIIDENGRLAVVVEGLVLDPDFDLGNVGLLDSGDVRINPSTAEGQAAILAKIIAAPSTEATAAAILAKIIAAPSTEAKQDSAIAADVLYGAGVRPIDLAVEGQSATNTHTLKGSAEEIAGATPFTAGATVEIVGLDTTVYPAATEAQAEINAISSAAGVPIRVKLVGQTVWIDAETDGTYTVTQVSA